MNQVNQNGRKNTDESEFRLLRKLQVLEAYTIVLLNYKGVPNWIRYTYGEHMINSLISITDKLVQANAIQWTNRSKAISLAREASFQFDSFKAITDKFLDFGNITGIENADEDRRFADALASLKKWSGINFNISTRKRQYFSWLRTDFGKSLGSWLKAIQLVV